MKASIAVRYLRAKLSLKAKTLLQQKANFIKASEMNQTAIREAKAENREFSILAFNGHANYKAEHDFSSALNLEIQKINGQLKGL